MVRCEHGKLFSLLCRKIAVGVRSHKVQAWYVYSLGFIYSDIYKFIMYNSQ